MGGDWRKIPEFNLSSSSDNIKRISDYFERMTKRHSIWGFKDPRTSLLLDIYNKVDSNIKYVWAMRNINEVANSLFKRNNMPREEAMALWLSYNSAIDNSLRKNNNDYIQIYYEDLIKNPKYQIKRVLQWANSKDLRLNNEVSNFIFKKNKNSRV